MTATFGESNILVDEALPKARKAYTITKQREKWTEEEHRKFLEALQLHGRNWRQIEEQIGTKTTIQIRSHAQKFFSKVARESTNSNDGTNNTLPIHIPPPRPKRKPARPYPRKLGSVFSGKQSIPALKKPEKLPAKEMVVNQKENGSPTSVLSTVTSELAGSEYHIVPSGSVSPVASVVGSNEQDNGAQLSGSSGDEQIRCTSPNMDVTDSVPKFPSPEESAQRSEVHISVAPEEEMCVESDSSSLKLFGKTVAVKSVSMQNIDNDNSSTHREQASEPVITPIELPTTEATQSSWLGMLPFLYYMPHHSGDGVSPVAVAPFPFWGQYGVLPYPLIKPEAVFHEASCIYSGNSASKEMMRVGSFTGSSSASSGELNDRRAVGPVESGNTHNLEKVDSVDFSSVKECYEKPVRGFVPYKRQISRSKKIAVEAMAEDGESELTRLCL